MNENQLTEGQALDEQWDRGELGRDEQFARRVDGVDEAAIDAALDLQQISIRLQKSLIEDFKRIARLHGLGYQPLMRQVLTRFVDSEKKRVLREASESFAAQTEQSIADEATQRQRAA